MNRVLGSTMIIAGTTIGAAMLALPVVSQHAGFVSASLLLLGLWIIMAYGALVLLEILLQFPQGTSFSTLGNALLGRFGYALINISMVALFYCLTTAYIAGGASFLERALHSPHLPHLPHYSFALLFTIGLGGLVAWKTSAVDVTNRCLLGLKMFAFLAVSALLMPHINSTLLFANTPNHYHAAILLILPVFFTAFGFHGSIPSLVKYVGPQPQALKKTFIIGSAIPLILYILWEAVTLGVLPQTGATSFSSADTHTNPVSQYIFLISHQVQQPIIRYGIHFFTDIAVTTSFLGVTLGLFDFFVDIIRNTRFVSSRRLIATLITFIPPLCFALVYPQGFIAALGYAAIPLALLAVILPSVMALRLRNATNYTRPYQAPGGTLGLVSLFIFGIFLIAVQLYFHPL